MPDITMCEGGDCRWRKSCYRHTATPTPQRQSYFMNPPVKSNGLCEHFMFDGDVSTMPGVSIERICERQSCHRLLPRTWPWVFCSKECRDGL